MELPRQPQSALGSAYRIERLLGRGGMATVWLAHDLRHDRPVALKVLHAELAQTLDPERFDREIKLAARLQHPRILTVLDSGDAAGHLWFTMPYVEGQRRVMLGVALAYLGRYPEAIASAQQGLAANRRPIDIPYFRHQLVRIYLKAGDDNRALDGLELLPATPYTLSPGRLRVDHGFAPLRNNVRFRRLLEGTT